MSSKRAAMSPAGDLHPDIVDPLQEVDLRVGDLVDHLLRVIADGIEALGHLAVAIPDLHGLRVLSDDLIEHPGLAKRAGDDGDLVLIQVRDLLQQAVDGCVLALGRRDANLL